MNPRQFERAVEQAIESIPETFRGRIENLTFLVEEWPDEQTLCEVGFDDPRDLLGFYRGCPLPERSLDYVGSPPDVIFIYRGAILNYVEETGESLPKVLRETVLHEVAHYFGFSEEEMDRIEEYWLKGE